ncbi:SseB family protein [Luteimicrobium subarcticum]|uniref:Type III secretion system (T3SS) SseB-like protein n=1 Tax=Luteimicrobium subarcticum TaxID=620910 RepID=A0A2M8WTP0_9MICO|nr:SseB family protein [Luteimicrobium subarcticum]PJI94313.1 type III secretion system (T3SS) SseB-like protein [Luteimicrobium subarcticum]
MTGRALPPTSGFAGDDGSADAELADLLAAWAGGTATLAAVVARLGATRVLVPVLAELEASDVTEDGLHVDKEASSGVVALEAPDGRRALPVFTSVASMAAWRREARPVPVEVPRAALSAVSEDWALLVVDPAGPVTAVVPRPAVWALAQGRPWLPAVIDGVVDADVVAAVAAVADVVPHVASADAQPGRTAEVAVVLRIDPGLDRAGLDRTIAGVNAHLAASPVVGERVDSLELRIGRAG